MRRLLGADGGGIPSHDPDNDVLDDPTEASQPSGAELPPKLDSVDPVAGQSGEAPVKRHALPAWRRTLGFQNIGAAYVLVAVALYFLARGTYPVPDRGDRQGDSQSELHHCNGGSELGDSPCGRSLRLVGGRRHGCHQRPHRVAAGRCGLAHAANDPGRNGLRTLVRSR